MILLSEAACQLIGLVPGGPVEPQVYGLQPLRRQESGWSFRVVEPWRLEIVRAMLWNLAPGLGTPSIGWAVWRKLGYGSLPR